MHDVPFPSGQRAQPLAGVGGFSRAQQPTAFARASQARLRLLLLSPRRASAFCAMPATTSSYGGAESWLEDRCRASSLAHGSLGRYGPFHCERGVCRREGVRSPLQAGMAAPALLSLQLLRDSCGQYARMVMSGRLQRRRGCNRILERPLEFVARQLLAERAICKEACAVRVGIRRLRLPNPISPRVIDQFLELHCARLRGRTCAGFGCRGGFRGSDAGKQRKIAGSRTSCEQQDADQYLHLSVGETQETFPRHGAVVGLRVLIPSL